MKRYFYVTIHFSPIYEDVILTKVCDNVYKNVETGEFYRKRLLYDFGFGQENGFEILPPLSFYELIGLIEKTRPLQKKKFFQKYSNKQIEKYKIHRDNLYGAVSVIMQDYVEELIEFLSDKIETDYFSDLTICENFKIFCFDSQLTRSEGKVPGGVLTQSYQEILDCYPHWKQISSKVISQIYKTGTETQGDGSSVSDNSGTQGDGSSVSDNSQKN